MFWDLYITENEGNGGDIKFNGKDFVIVNGIECMPYLGMCGGNVEADTKPRVQANSKDWWGNNLMLPDDPSQQMNSTFERTINSVPLTSLGRQLIENAIKEDLKFLKDLAVIDISVNVISDDRIDIKLIVKQNNLQEKVVVINFKKSTDGDFFILDFNDDFLV